MAALCLSIVALLAPHAARADQPFVTESSGHSFPDAVFRGTASYTSSAVEDGTLTVSAAAADRGVVGYPGTFVAAGIAPAQSFADGLADVYITGDVVGPAHFAITYDITSFSTHVSWVGKPPPSADGRAAIDVLSLADFRCSSGCSTGSSSSLLAINGIGFPLACAGGCGSTCDRPTSVRFRYEFTIPAGTTGTYVAGVAGVATADASGHSRSSAEATIDVPHPDFEQLG